MSKEERKNLPDPRDGFICEEGPPYLVVRFGQVVSKTPKHGAIHGLPKNENKKTPKTEKNALHLRDSIVNMPNREEIVWFENGGFQKGTDRGYDSVNIYDPKTKVIGVFRKEGNEDLNPFTTTCKLTLREEDYLLESGGSFRTEACLDLIQQNELPIQNNFHEEKGPNNDL